MTKIDLISACENWLVENDFQDHALLPSQAKSKDVSRYLMDTISWVKYKDKKKVNAFCKYILPYMVKCRGILPSLKKYIVDMAKTNNYYVLLSSKKDANEWAECYFTTPERIHKDAKEMKKKVLQIIPYVEAHRCKYCGTVTEGSNEDVLCPNCHELFGHTYFSEL